MDWVVSHRVGVELALTIFGAIVTGFSFLVRVEPGPKVSLRTGLMILAVIAFASAGGVFAVPATPATGPDIPPAVSAAPISGFPVKLRYFQTGKATEVTYQETLAAGEVIVGSAAQFNRQGISCQAFLVTGPLSDYHFVLLDGDYFVYTNVLTVAEGEDLLQQLGVNRAVSYGGCQEGAVHVIRLP